MVSHSFSEDSQDHNASLCVSACFSIVFFVSIMLAGVANKWIFFHLSSSHIYSSILPDNNAYIFANALLILYCNFSFSIISSIAMPTLYTYSHRFFREHNILSDGRVVSMTKNGIMVVQYILCQRSEIHQSQMND